MRQSRFYDKVVRVEKLAKVLDPCPEEVSNAIRLLREPPVAYYFFEALCQPLNLSWFPALANAGYFDSFPEPVEGRVWQWPARTYVKQCANAEPELVARIIRTVKTENMSVYTALAEAAAELPAEWMAAVSPVLAGWLGKPAFRLVDALASVMGKLAKEDKAPQVLHIVQRFLEIGGVARFEDWIARVELTLPLHDVSDILSKHLNELAEVDPAGTLAVLESSLLQLLQLKRWRRGERQDNSSIWRESIGQGDSRAVHSPNDLLVSAIRDVLVSAAANRPEAIRADLSRYLIGKSLPYVLTRLAIYTLARSPETYWDLVVTACNQRGYMSERTLKTEFVELVQATFGKLRERQPELAESVLSRIDRMGRVTKQRLARARNRGFNEDITRIGAKRRQRDWLIVVHEYLDDRRLKKLAALQSDLDKADVIAASEREQSIAESERLVSSSVSHEDIRRNPQVCVARAADFAPGKADPADIQAFLSGLRFAVQDGNQFDWNEVIAYSESVIQAQDDALKLMWSDRMEAYRGWHVVAVADLLDIGLARGSLDPSLRVRELLMSMMNWVRTATPNESSQPSESQAPWDDSFSDPRSMTLTALIHYANQMGLRDPDKPNEWPKWQKLDEKVREVLEEHLNPEAILSASARYVFGRFLPHLAWLDYAWTENNLGLILPPGREKSDDWWAVWSSYLFFNQFYQPLLPLLRHEYKRGISRLKESRPEWAEKSDEGLATHVMNAMCLGLEPYSDEASLTRAFLCDAPASLRGQALRILGDWLRLQAFSDFDEVWDMLKGFWRDRVIGTPTHPPSKDSEELAGFAFWLRGIRERPSVLVDLIRPIIRPLVEHRRTADLIDYLAQHADDQPVAVELLNEILQVVEPYWLVYPEKAIRQVLEGARAAGTGIGARDAAVNRLGELGSKDFRNLLPELD